MSKAFYSFPTETDPLVTLGLSGTLGPWFSKGLLELVDE